MATLLEEQQESAWKPFRAAIPDSRLFRRVVTYKVPLQSQTVGGGGKQDVCITFGLHSVLKFIKIYHTTICSEDGGGPLRPLEVADLEPGPTGSFGGQSPWHFNITDAYITDAAVDMTGATERYIGGLHVWVPARHRAERYLSFAYGLSWNSSTFVCPHSRFVGFWLCKMMTCRVSLHHVEAAVHALSVCSNMPLVQSQE